MPSDQCVVSCRLVLDPNDEGHGYSGLTRSDNAVLKRLGAKVHAELARPSRSRGGQAHAAAVRNSPVAHQHSGTARTPCHACSGEAACSTALCTCTGGLDELAEACEQLELEDVPLSDGEAAASQDASCPSASPAGRSSRSSTASDAASQAIPDPFGDAGTLPRCRVDCQCPCKYYACIWGTPPQCEAHQGGLMVCATGACQLSMNCMDSSMQGVQVQ